jgi:Fe2+ transport system protein FeoA
MAVTASFDSPANLYQFGDEVDLRILLISGGWEIRRSFNRMGIHAGDRVRILRRAPFGGPLVVDNAGTRVAISRELAEKIRAQALP